MMLWWADRRASVLVNGTNWTDVGPATSAFVHGIALQHGETYKVEQAAAGWPRRACSPA
jgi:hypothetical protein